MSESAKRPFPDGGEDEESRKRRRFDDIPKDDVIAQLLEKDNVLEEMRTVMAQLRKSVRQVTDDLTAKRKEVLSCI